MMRRVWQWIYEAVFYLPGARHQLAQLDSEDARNRARLHVWRAQFAAPSYWLLMLFCCAGVLAALWFGVRVIDECTLRMRGSFPGLRAAALIGYVTALTAFGAVASMWPLRRIVRQQLWTYLRGVGVHLCRHCGYDLRGISERCPECGRRIG